MLSPEQKVYIRKARELGMRICEIVEVMRLPYVDVNNEVQKLNREQPGWVDRPDKYANGKPKRQTPAEVKRDDRTLAIYQALRGDLGQTAAELAELAGCEVETATADLEYLALGELAERRDGKWYGSAKMPGRSFGDEDDPPIVRILGGRCSGHRKLKAANANW